MIDRVVIGAAQMGPSSFTDGKVNKKENVHRIIALLEKGIRENVKIVCFPELALTDYFPVRMDMNFEQYFDQIPNNLTKDIFTLTRNIQYLSSCLMRNLMVSLIIIPLESFKMGH